MDYATQFSKYFILTVNFGSLVLLLYAVYLIVLNRRYWASGAESCPLGYVRNEKDTAQYRKRSRGSITKRVQNLIEKNNHRHIN